MTESYYYLVKFSASCEECGKHFEGVISKEVPVNDSAIAGDALNSMADSADLAIRRKSLEAAVRDKRWSELDMSYGTGHGCPHCGARQSWDPMERPEEPTIEAKGKAGNIGCGLLAAFFVGGIVAFVEYLVQTSIFGEDDPTVMFVVWLVCLVVGLVLAIRGNKKDDEKAADSYPERMREYERELSAYEAFQQQVKARATHNEPTVDLSSGVTSKRKPLVGELVKASPKGAPAPKKTERERVNEARVDEALGRMEGSEAGASSSFKAGKDRRDIGLCAKALDELIGTNANSVVAELANVDDVEFLKAVVAQWLGTAENPLEISEKLKGKAIVGPAVAKGLEDYCCPDGHLHELEDTSYIMHADTDERCGAISCKRCGYEYTVDGSVQRYGKNFGYTFRADASHEWLMTESKQVRCRPGGYRCASCGEYVQPSDDGPAPCICPSCGVESHDWKHYDGEIVHRDYSSGMSYDYCARCGKKDNLVDHNTW